MHRRSFFQMQPTFELQIPSDFTSLAAQVRARLHQDSNASFAGQVLDLRVAKEERRYWSPHLTVQFEDIDDGKTQAYGRFSPRPEVWTMFAGIYAILIFVMFIGAICAYVQWTLGFAPTALLVIPGGLMQILALHTIGFKGQQWSEHQMDELKERFDALTRAENN